MKQVSSPLIGKHRNGTSILLKLRILLNSMLARSQQRNDKVFFFFFFFLMLIILQWLKINGWCRSHSYNTLMKESIFKSVAIR